MTQANPVGDLAIKVANDPNLLDQMKDNPVATLNREAVSVTLPDTLIYRIVVGSLGLAVLIALVGAIVLASQGLEIPDVLTALGSAAVGALAGLLAPSPVRG